jgi:hypothetical protein
MKKGLLLVFSYIAWILSFLLSVWLIWRSLGVVSYAAARSYLSASEMSQWQIGKQGIFLEELWVIITGIGVVISMYFTEAYFRNGVSQGNLWKRMGKVFGLLIILIFLVDGLTLGLGGVDFSWLYMGILALELGAGFVLIEYARSAWPFRPKV